MESQAKGALSGRACGRPQPLKAAGFHLPPSLEEVQSKMNEEDAVKSPHEQSAPHELHVEYQHEVEKEKRQLRHWLIKTVVVTCACCVLMVVASTLYTTLWQGKKFESSLLHEFIRGVGEVIDALE